ncbi:AAA family ATPase [Corynebacterium sp.]|uniref:AAA family ATPase n=1 Tax=Corynebacterium sp. TaxID=1720 RepID=UPI0027B9328E|nr:AAA family ATPase [Corynebacterium sp.]
MMKLHSVELTNVRGVEHLLLEDLPETGVVVIEGENEAGKSTVVEAIDIVLTEKHSAKSKKIKALKPVGRDESPEITVEATVGPHRFRIHKRWLGKKASELHVFTPRQGQWTGAEADNELARILNEHMDRALVDALFVRQEDGDEGIAAVGIPSLTAALEEESGADAVAEDAELLSRIEAEYTTYYTAKKERPAGDYKAAIEALDRAEEKHQAALAAVRELDGVVESYEAAEHAQAAAQEQLPAALEDCEKRDAELAQARAAQEKVTAQEAAVARASEAVKRAQEEAARRTALIAEHTAAVQAAERAATTVTEAAQRAEADATERGKLEQQLEEAKASYEAVRAELRRARSAQQRAEYTALGTRLEALSELEEALRERRRELAAAPAVKNLPQLEEAAREVTVQQRLRAAAAAKLHVSGTGVMSVDGEERELGGEEEAIELRDGTTLQIGTVTARYAASAGDSGDDGVERARAELARLLEDAGCEDVDAARAAQEKHAELSAAADNAERELKAALGGDDIGELRAQYEAFATDDADGVDDADYAESDSASAPELETEQETTQEDTPRPVAEVEREEEELRRRLDELDRALAPYREDKAGRALDVATVRVEEAKSQLERKSQELEAAREQRADADMDSAVAAAEAEHAKEKAALKELSGVDLETAESLAKGAKAHLESLKQAERDADGDKRELKGQITQHEGAAEALEKAAADLTVATERHAAVERRAHAARYLRALMLRHRDTARQRYAAPFVNALNALARPVFGGDVDFQLSEELQVETRSHDGQTIDFGDLSGGAKEQLGILTRFAIAQLVAGGGAPVVIDDALGSTDATRLQLMSTLFDRVGRQAQVIVFTCMPGRFSRVPGRTELSMKKLKSV